MWVRDGSSVKQIEIKKSILFKFSIVGCYDIRNELKILNVFIAFKIIIPVGEHGWLAHSNRSLIVRIIMLSMTECTSVYVRHEGAHSCSQFPSTHLWFRRNLHVAVFWMRNSFKILIVLKMLKSALTPGWRSRCCCCGGVGLTGWTSGEQYGKFKNLSISLVLMKYVPNCKLVL